MEQCINNVVEKQDYVGEPTPPISYVAVGFTGVAQSMEQNLPPQATLTAKLTEERARQAEVEANVLQKIRYDMAAAMQITLEELHNNHQEAFKRIKKRNSLNLEGGDTND